MDPKGWYAGRRGTAQLPLLRVRFGVTCEVGAPPRVTEMPCFYCICGRNIWMNLHVSAEHCQEAASAVPVQEQSCAVCLLGSSVGSAGSSGRGGRHPESGRGAAVPGATPGSCCREKRGTGAGQALQGQPCPLGPSELPSSHMGPAGPPVDSPRCTHAPRIEQHFVWRQAACSPFVGAHLHLAAVGTCAWAEKPGHHSTLPTVASCSVC